MITPLLLLAVPLGQLSVPFDVEGYYKSSCSSSQRTGYVPVVTQLTCTTHAGMDGCTATGRVYLNELVGTNYWYMCDRPVQDGTVAIQDAEIELSGIKFDALGAQQSFKQLEVRVEATHFDPVTFLLEWRVVLNWKLAPPAMVDRFTADVFGEIVWTTNQDSRLVRGSGTCSGSAETCTASATSFTWPAGWIYAGSALRGVDVESQSSSAQGILPSLISVDPGEVVKTSGAKITWQCTLEDGNSPPPGITFSYNSLSIIGAPSEVYRAWVGPFGHLSSPAVTAGFYQPFHKRAAARCGLRSFAASSGRSTGGTTAMIWFGADSRDCGWSPGDLYTGMGLYGFEDYLNTGGEKVEFSLDATRLP